MVPTNKFGIYKVYSRRIKTEAVFTMTEIKNERNIDFLQHSLLGIQYTNSIKFSIGRSNSEIPLLMQCKAMLLELFFFFFFFFFHGSIPSNLILELIQFKK